MYSLILLQVGNFDKMITAFKKCCAYGALREGSFAKLSRVKTLNPVVKQFIIFIRDVIWCNEGLYSEVATKSVERLATLVRESWDHNTLKPASRDKREAIARQQEMPTDKNIHLTFWVIR